MIELKPIDRDNFRAVIALRVAEHQKSFVASNVYSLAQAKAQPECIPLAACDGDTPVGFAMYCMDEDDREYWIYRLMIDERHQGRGYGRQVMNALLERIAADRNHDRVYISFEPDNEAARRLYESLGFRPDGRTIDGEIVYCLRYGRRDAPEANMEGQEQ